MCLVSWLALVSAALLVFTYVGYPLVMLILARCCPARPKPGTGEAPQAGPITVIMTVHNEERAVLAKVDNLLALDRAGRELSLVLVDDASTDATVPTLERAIAQRPTEQIHLLKLAAVGKAEAINQAVAHIRQHLPPAQSRLVFLCDVRQTLERDTLVRLLEALADPSVGYAYGSILSPSEKGPGLYWKYETQIRRWESAFYASPGGTGAISLMYLDLVTPLPRGLLLDDVFLPMECVFQGKRIVLVPEARATDVEFGLDREFLRKCRTMTGAFQYIAARPRCLNPLGNRIWFQFWSHKVLRLASPYLLVILAITSALTAQAGWLPGLVLLAGQAIFYAAAALPGRLSIPKLSPLARTFLAVNAAAVVGLLRFLQGNYQWSTAKDKDRSPKKG